MKQTNILAMLIAIGCVASSIIFYKNHQATNKPLPFKTEIPQIRTIRHIISTLGVIELKEVMKVGSIQAGFVKEVYVKEGDMVVKNQLLALIDTARNTSDVEAETHRVEKVQAEAAYQKKFFARQKVLYNANQLSKDAYERAERDLKKAIADLEAEKAILKRTILEYESTFLRSPDNGFVTAVHASKGMVANDISNITLFEIAKDTRNMKVIFDIDESEIGNVQYNQKVIFIPNSFPELRIKSTINEISYTPKGASSGYTQTQQSNAYSYKADADIENGDDLLRPGMLVNASISVKKVNDSLSISGLSFYLNPNIIEKIAQKIGYSVISIHKEEQKRICKKHPQKIIRFPWTVHDKSFIQKAITVGITDNMYWQIIEGLSETDNVLIDIQELDDMQSIYSRWFKGSL